MHNEILSKNQPKQKSSQENSVAVIVNNQTQNTISEKNNSSIESNLENNSRLFDENSEENIILSENFKGNIFFPQILNTSGCLNIDFNSFGQDYRTTLCSGAIFKQIVNQNNKWNILEISLNTPLSSFSKDNDFFCVGNNSWNKNTRPEEILIDGILCSHKKMYWQIHFDYDKELKYFYISGISVEQCGPYEIQKDSEFLKRLILKYGEPLKILFDEDINTITYINFENKQSNEMASVYLNAKKNSIGGGVFKVKDCNGGRPVSIHLNTIGDPALLELFKKIKRIKRNAKSHDNKPQF